MLNIIISFFGLLLASFYDLKSRTLPRKLTYAMIDIGFLIQALRFSIDNLLSTFACIAFAYALYKLGVWGGGDTKLFFGLSALVPVFSSIMFFPLVVLLVSLLMVFPVVIVYVVYVFFKSNSLRSIIKQKFISNIKNIILSSFTLSCAYAVLSFIANSMFDINYFLVSSAYIVLTSTIFFIGKTSFLILKEHVLTYKVDVSKLEEGMILKYNKLFEGKINMLLARGLTIDELESVKSIAKSNKLGFVEVKKTLPFVPVILAGFLATLVYLTYF